MKENGERKQSCVDRVKALAELDNHNTTAEEVRKLQSQWKQIGPTEFRDEKRCRGEFQTACDAVFKVLNEHRAKNRERSRPPEQRIHAELLENLAAAGGISANPGTKPVRREGRGSVLAAC